jgi:APA family basic amino acid/polyamine antiporter
VNNLTPKPAPQLKRAVGLVPLVLYGLGVTIGAGIYVLVGEAAGKAGIYAPSAFLLAALVMGFSAGSMAEFASRIPKSAGDAAYVEAAFGNRFLTLATGGSIILAGIVAAATIALGCAGYVVLLVDLPLAMVTAIVIILMAMIAGWGIKESVTFAGVLTILEILGLVAIIAAGFESNPSLLMRIPETIPSFSDYPAVAGVIGASLLAFFAFIGFDDVVHIAEETKDPSKIMPWAIAIILFSVTILYFMVSLVAIDALSIDVLASSRAPIGLLFEKLTGISPVSISLIAILATMNGVVIQIILASRVTYGLASQKQLPSILAKVNLVTQTPLVATAIVTLLILVLALFVELGQLAELTSQLVLMVFLLVNISLIRVKQRGDVAAKGVFTVPIIIPVIGAVSSGFLLIAPLLLTL